MKLLTVFLFLFLIPAIVLAASPWTTKTTNKDKMLGKLDFGIKNLLAGWTEIFTQPMNGKDAKGVTVGIGKGLAYAVADTVGGALHLITFPITQLDVPLPENGVKID